MHTKSAHKGSNARTETNDDETKKNNKEMFALEMGIFPCLDKQTKECCISCF